MLSKEGCEKALARIVNDDYYFENDPYGEDKASAFDKDVDMIEQLIEEHFGVKSEKELQNIYLNNNLDEVIEIQKNNLTDSYMIGLYNGLVTAKAILLNNNDNIKLVDNTIYPYKFEDLKEGMWVWDEKNELCNLIFETSINCVGEQEIEFQWEMIDIDGDEFLYDIFEENRFFPVQYANYLGGI